MTDTTNTQAATGNTPPYIAYQVRNGKDKGFFTRIGVAWPNKDGKGFNIHLESVPLDGKITLRIASEKKD